MKFDWSSGALAEGLRCYRAEAFFLAHEHWEGVWLTCEEPEKTFLQALIQVAAAFHHLQRGNRRGTESLLGRALRRIDPIAISCGGIMLEPLREEIGVWLRALELHDGPLPSSFPQICPLPSIEDLK
jgi:predicted metal-dependent hydrolase